MLIIIGKFKDVWLMMITAQYLIRMLVKLVC
nr:MAG TPA: hypothetical protein [Crassvirales sp.]